MSVNCSTLGQNAGLPQAPEAGLSDNLALQTRYDAVISLSAALRSRSSIEDLTSIVCREWKYSANVGRWRLITQVDGKFLILCCHGVNGVMQWLSDADMLHSDMKLWNLKYADRMDMETFHKKFPDLQNWIGDEQTRQVSLLPLDRCERGYRFVLCLASARGPFHRLDAKFINAVSSVFVGELGYLLTMERLTRKLEQEARQDPLTGLANRRTFLADFDRVWRYAMRHQQPISLLMLDIDYFKQYNDRFGHLAGDECLRKVAEILNSTIRRPLDLLGRVGGEEFAIVLPETTPEGALGGAGRIIEAINLAALPHEVGGMKTNVTLSVGAATVVPSQGQAMTELMDMADKALYEAKRSGRNRVKAAPYPIPCNGGGDQVLGRGTAPSAYSPRAAGG